MAIDARETARRAKLEQNSRWCMAAIQAAPQDVLPRQAYDLAHQREAAAATPPGPVPQAPAAAPAPQRDPAAMAIIDACTAAGKPALAATLIAQGLTVAQARHALAVDSWGAPLSAAQAAS